MNELLEPILNQIRRFRDERDWGQFHDPKSMAASITIEAAELLEHFQWKTKEEAEQYIKTNKNEIGEEIADIAMYLFELSDNMGIDLIKTMQEKLEKNAKKYPVEKAKGKHTKYTQL